MKRRFDRASGPTQYSSRYGAFTPSHSTANVLWFYLRPQALRVALLLACLLSCIGLELWAPMLLRRFIDTATAGGGLHLLWLIAAAFILVNLLARAIRIGMTYVSEQVGWTATNRLRGDLAQHCLSLDLDFHFSRTPGEIIECIDGDVTALARFFSDFVVHVIGGVVLLLGILFLLFMQDYRVGWVFAVFSAIAFALLRGSRNYSVPRVIEEREARTRLSAFISERVAGLDEIRANGGGAHVLAGHDDVSSALVASGVRAVFAGRMVLVLAAAIFVAGSIAALSIGIYLYNRHEASIGTVYLLVQYMAMTRAPLNQIGLQLQQMQRAVASLHRIRTMFAQAPSMTGGDRLPQWRGAPAAQFDSVDFDYVPGSPMLRDISFFLAPGEVLGLVGATGSGKTTLVRLLCRLYEPRAGRILMGGEDIATVLLPALRERIAMVTQEVQVFGATVRDNVRLFDESIDDAAVRAVLDTVGLSSWLRRQPNDLDTPLAGPASLSAGEAQLLAFARVFLRDPDLVVLDEPGSRLDPATDRLIERAIHRLLTPPVRGPRTAIVIAHKLATLARVDRVLILEQGRIVESGPRAALAADPSSRLAALMTRGVPGVLQ